MQHNAKNIHPALRRYAVSKEKNAPRRKDMTPEQKSVIDRLMLAALKTWDRDLIQRCAQTGADTGALLATAISRRDAEMVKLAVSFGANVNAQVESSSGRRLMPVLHYAHEHFNEEVFSLLLNCGVPIDGKNALGETVAQLAAKSGDFSRLRFYLDKGADASACAQDAMFSAISKKNTEMLEWSFANGADVKAVRRAADGGAPTALHEAYGSYNETIISLLLDKGIDVNAPNAAGETVLHLAARDGDAQRTAFLLKRGADPLAVAYGDVSVLDEALRAVQQAQTAARTEDFRYSSSPSFNDAAKKKQANARDTLNMLLDCVKELYGRAPYDVAAGRDISVSKPVTLAGKKQDAKPDAPPHP